MTAARVLVVDDEPQIRRALQTGLRANGFAVEAVADGETALDAIALNPPNVVILDLGLPGIDGIEVVRQIRTWSSLPIIILSVLGAERDKVLALDTGADDYLTKPFGMAELVARIRVALRHAASPQQGKSVFAFGDLRIDLVRRVVTRCHREIHLTPTEYDLLQALAVNAGRVLTHRMLLTQVWGPASADATHYLHVYVNQLRRKIEPDPTRPQFIVTEPGVGYRFRPDPPHVQP